jgi:hypothetical protein
LNEGALHVWALASGLAIDFAVLKESEVLEDRRQTNRSKVSRFAHQSLKSAFPSLFLECLPLREVTCGGRTSKFRVGIGKRSDGKRDVFRHFSTRFVDSLSFLRQLDV